MARAPFAEWTALRWATFERDDFTCQYCGQRAPEVRLEVDHRVPVRDGGTNEMSNLVTSCWACNRGREYSRWLAPKHRPLGASVGVGIRPGTKTAKIAEIVVRDPDITDAALAREVGTTPGSARVIRTRIKRYAVGAVHNETQPTRLVRLLGAGAMTPAELAATGGFRISRLPDIARRAREMGHEVDFLDGAYFLMLPDA